MQEIRNNSGKLVCRIDKPTKTVEIAVKGSVTTIRFSDDGTIKVTNKEKTVCPPRQLNNPQTARRQGNKFNRFLSRLSVCGKHGSAD